MLKRFFSHGVLILGTVILILGILDYYNPTMNFEFNRYSKWVLYLFLLISCGYGAYLFLTGTDSWKWLIFLIDITVAVLILAGIYGMMIRPAPIETLEQKQEPSSSPASDFAQFALPETIPETVISGGTTACLEEYQGSHVKIHLDRVVKDRGISQKVFYIAQIYVSDVSQIQSAFAKNTYGRNLYDTPESICEQNQAVLAINGDYYGGNDGGIVIRNGIAYRTGRTDSDICVLFKDGRLKTYDGAGFDAEQVIRQGAWQAWTFGPVLLDGSGNPILDYHTSDYIKNNTHPRTAIGCIAPGHYVFVVEDGRQEGYSSGITLDEMANVLIELGCQSGYNMDGGASSVLMWNGEKASHPDHGGRELSDMIIIPFETENDGSAGR